MLKHTPSVSNKNAFYVRAARVCIKKTELRDAPKTPFSEKACYAHFLLANAAIASDATANTAQVEAGSGT